MDQFVQRTLASMSLHVTHASDLSRAIPAHWHEAGDAAIPQSFEDLQYALVRIGERARGAIDTNPGLAEVTLAELTAAQAYKLENQKVEQDAQTAAQTAAAQAYKLENQKVEQDSPKYEAHSLASFGDTEGGGQGSNSGFVAKYASKIEGTPANQDTGLGSNIDLSEAGYISVLQLNNNHEMEVFLRRTISDLGLNIVSERGLKSMIPSLSGEAGMSTFGGMKGKLLNMLGKVDAWVADPNQIPEGPHKGGGDAPVSEDGYEFTANLHSNPEMVSFIDRVVDSMGLHVTNHGGVEGLAPFYSGDKQVGDLQALKSEIVKASDTPGSWVTNM